MDGAGRVETLTTEVEVHRPSTEVVRILGIPFSAVSYSEVVVRILAMMRNGGSHQIVLGNAHAVNLAYGDAEYRRILQAASLVLRDGVGVEIGALLAGRRLAHNFVGTDFVPRLLGSLGRGGVRVFLYGAAPGVAARAARVLVARAPGTEIVGVENGFGDPATVVSAVRGARPDVLLVALGNPLQERWIGRNLDRLDARVAIGVGALFDYLAGAVPRAPRWVQAARCEWVYRLFLEPRRLWRRYVLGNPQFLWRLATSRRRPAW